MVSPAGPSSLVGTVPPQSARRPDLRHTAGPTEKQLDQLLSRLLAEADGDPATEWAVRQHLAASCARYATARVRDFLLILIERDVRRRLSEA
ncbi:MAG: three-helix bundle dimerization domain-containing protein [Blastococcus sp.]